MPKLELYESRKPPCSESPQFRDNQAANRLRRAESVYHPKYGAAHKATTIRLSGSQHMDRPSNSFIPPPKPAQNLPVQHPKDRSNEKRKTKNEKRKTKNAKQGPSTRASIYQKTTTSTKRVTTTFLSPFAIGDYLFLPQQFLYFLPLPQGHGSFRPTRGLRLRIVSTLVS